MNFISFVGDTHLIDHNYFERQPPTKRSRPDSDTEDIELEEGEGWQGETREEEVCTTWERQGNTHFEVCGHDEVPEAENYVVWGDETLTMTSSAIIQKEQWSKIQDLERQNAVLKSMVEDLQDQLSELSNRGASDNELLSEIISLNRSKCDNPNSKTSAYSAVIQKFSLTMSTYSPKAYR